MILAAHALTGAVIGKYVSNTWLVIILSVILHFAMDTFRHGEYLDRKSSIKETYWKVSLDILIGLILIATILLSTGRNSLMTFNIFIGAFFSMLPDGLTFLYWKANLKFLKKIFDFHAWVHPYPLFAPERKWNLRNSINDIVISVLAIILLLI